MIGEVIPIIVEVKNAIVHAKKNHDKEKYISVLEEQIEILECEVERLNTRLISYEKNEFKLNSNHLELFMLFKNSNYYYDENKINEYVKKSIDLEIALSELIDKGYFLYDGVYDANGNVDLIIPEDKKLEFLRALKNQ